MMVLEKLSRPGFVVYLQLIGHLQLIKVGTYLLLLLINHKDIITCGLENW